MQQVTLDGETLTTTALLRCSKPATRIILSAEAAGRISDGRAIVDRILESNEVVYGINTGFGLFSNVTVSAEKVSELQENLIRSHAAGCGAPLPRERTRMLLSLRINVLTKGHSGISLQVVEQMMAALNADCIPVVPSKGTVGASGDLAPLAYAESDLDRATGALACPLRPCARSISSPTMVEASSPVSAGISRSV